MSRSSPAWPRPQASSRRVITDAPVSFAQDPFPDAEDIAEDGEGFLLAALIRDCPAKFMARDERLAIVCPQDAGAGAEHFPVGRLRLGPAPLAGGGPG